MAYDDEVARSAARARLEARMKRRSEQAALARAGGPGQGREPEQHPEPEPEPKPSLSQPEAAGGRAGRSRKPQAPVLAIAAIAVAVALAIALALALPRCSRETPLPKPDGADGAARDAPAATLDRADAAQERLVELIGEEEAVKLLAAAAVDADALWIAAHPDAYAGDGAEVQSKILKLAANEPEAIGYVRAYPSRYPAARPGAGSTDALPEGPPSPDVPATAVPHLYQWDMRWGYTTYSSAAFGLTGCGPTALAMVARSLAGREDATPYEMGELAEERGYMSQFNGTGSEYFVEMADELDLRCELLYPTGDSIAEALSAGAVVVANLGPGQFTEGGHFFVCAGLAGDGSVIVNDPYSVERSSRTWDAQVIADESIALFAYTAP